MELNESKVCMAHIRNSKSEFQEFQRNEVELLCRNTEVIVDVHFIRCHIKLGTHLVSCEKLKSHARNGCAGTTPDPTQTL